jgi:hypothetical protein
MKAYWDSVYTYKSRFSWPRHVPAALPPVKEAFGNHWTGGRVGPRTGLYDMKKTKFLNLPGLELRPIRRSRRSQSLYRLSYPGYFNLSVGDIYSYHSALKGRQSVCVNLLYVPYPSRIEHIRESALPQATDCWTSFDWTVSIIFTTSSYHVFVFHLTELYRYLYRREQYEMSLHGGTKYPLQYDVWRTAN